MRCICCCSVNTELHLNVTPRNLQFSYCHGHHIPKSQTHILYLGADVDVVSQFDCSLLSSEMT